MWTSKVMFSKYFEMRIILEVFYSRKYLIEQYLMKLCIRNLLMEKSLTFDVFLSFFLFWNLVFFTGTCVTDFQVQYSLVEKIYTRTYFEKILKRVSFWTVLQRIIVQNYFSAFTIFRLFNEGAKFKDLYWWFILFWPSFCKV